MSQPKEGAPVSENKESKPPVLTTDEVNILVGACNILDVIKSEWGSSWSEWDQSIRMGLNKLLFANQLPEHPTGSPAPQDALHKLTIETHNPSKWRFVDLETGEIWKKVTEHFVHADDIKIIPACVDSPAEGAEQKELRDKIAIEVIRKYPAPSANLEKTVNTFCDLRDALVDSLVDATHERERAERLQRCFENLYEIIRGKKCPVPLAVIGLVASAVDELQRNLAKAEAELAELRKLCEEIIETNEIAIGNNERAAVVIKPEHSIMFKAGRERLRLWRERLHTPAPPGPAEKEEK